MKYQAIIFDLDGTLLDTLDDLTDAFNTACRVFGCPVLPANKYKMLIGNGARNVIASRFRLHGISESKIEEGVSLFREAYRATNLNKTHPYPGITDVLNDLSRRPITLNVLSNKPHRDTERCIQKFFNIHQFQIIQGHQENNPLKPDPTMARKIMRECNIPFHRGLFIGDTAVDMETAHQAGMPAVGVTWGFRTRGELKRYGADWIINSPAEILLLLK
jgi:phosphoglycolate phosphatase